LGQYDLKKGHVITISNDTIIGMINVKNNATNSKICEFQAQGEKQVISYAPSDLISYQVESSKYYVSKLIVVDGKEYWAFLEFLVKGIANLYYYKVDDREYYFIEKDNKINILSDDKKVVTDEFGHESIKKTNRYKGTLLYLFQDGEGLSISIDNVDFSYESLINITEKYHNTVCKDYECIIYKKSTKSKIFIEPLISYGISLQGMKEYSGSVVDFMPVFGMNLRIQPTKIHHLWSFSIGFSYSFNSFNGGYNFTPTYGKTYVDSINLSYSIIRVPLLIQYSFPERKITPFLFSGFNLNSLFNYTYQIDRYTKLPHGDVPSYDLVSDTPSIQLGIIIGGGMLYNLNDKIKLVFSTNYEFRMNPKSTGYILEYTHYNSLMSNLGISYVLQ
jgi:hypothetical protein